MQTTRALHLQLQFAAWNVMLLRPGASAAQPNGERFLSGISQPVGIAARYPMSAQRVTRLKSLPVRRCRHASRMAHSAAQLSVIHGA